MKKVFFVLTVLFAVSQAITAQSIDSFIADFSNSEEVQTQKVDSVMLSAIKQKLDSTKQNFEDSIKLKILEKIKFIDVAKADNPSAELVKKCAGFTRNFTDDVDYQTVVKAANDNNIVLILSSKLEKEEKPLIIFAISDGGIAIVKVYGKEKFDLEKVKKIAEAKMSNNQN